VRAIVIDQSSSTFKARTGIHIYLLTCGNHKQVQHNVHNNISLLKKQVCIDMI
jgi:hypothetical protein